MKRIILALMCIISIQAFSEDLIVTKSDKSIKAKIEEVSDEEIKYREADNLTGPIFILKTSEITTIVFENGSVKNYQIGSTASQSAEKETELYPIKKVGGHLECNGKKISGTEFLTLTQNNCPEAFDLRNKGRNQFGAGSTLAICGVALSIAGLCVQDQVYQLAFLGVSLPCLITSLPLIACGAHKMDKAVGVYNKSCAKATPTSEIRFNVKSNGVSLSYNF